MELLEPFGTIWNNLEPFGTIWNARSALGTPEGHLEQSLRLYMYRASAHYRLPDAIHDIAHVIVRHIRTRRQAETDLEDGF